MYAPVLTTVPGARVTARLRRTERIASVLLLLSVDPVVIAVPLYMETAQRLLCKGKAEATMVAHRSHNEDVGVLRPTKSASPS
jgi:hypothetical protein